MEREREQVYIGKMLRKEISEGRFSGATFIVVIFLSAAYPEREWTDFVLSIGKEASEKRTEEYLLPIRLDDVKIVGIKSTTGYIDLRQTSVQEVATILADKINTIVKV